MIRSQTPQNTRPEDEDPVSPMAQKKREKERKNGRKEGRKKRKGS